jgi:hypothetical protein
MSVAGRPHVSGVSSRRTFTASMRSSQRSLRIAANGVASCRTALAPMNQERATCSPSAPGVGPRPVGELQPPRADRSPVSGRRIWPNGSGSLRPGVPASEATSVGPRWLLS